MLQRTLMNRRHILSDLLDSAQSHRRRNANGIPPPAYDDIIPEENAVADFDDKKELLAALIAKHRLSTQRTSSPLTTRLPHSALSNVPVRLCGLKLTQKSKQICETCLPPNLRPLILIEKRRTKRSPFDESDGTAGDPTTSSIPTSTNMTRLTELCCRGRCTEENIRQLCCSSK